MHAIHYTSASVECNQPEQLAKSIEGSACYLFYCGCMVYKEGCEEKWFVNK